MLKRFGKTKDPMAASNVVRACVAAPGAVADPAALVPLAELAVKAAPGKARLLPAALHRAGRHEAAVRHFEELAKSGKAGKLRAADWYFLAMAHHRLGHTEEARKCLDQGTRWLEGAEREVAQGKHWPWFERVEAEQLRKEAEALLKEASATPKDKEG
jgi:hypothetical protein